MQALEDRVERVPGVPGAPALDLRELEKSFGQVQALWSVSLCVYPGEVHASAGDGLKRTYGGVLHGFIACAGATDAGLTALHDGAEAVAPALTESPDHRSESQLVIRAAA